MKKEIRQYNQNKDDYKAINFRGYSKERFNYHIAGEVVANTVISNEVDKGIVLFCGIGALFKVLDN
ncbi:RpiB/LacA/LacB family sugar-phosphate isomerase [Catenibacterium mitsuokai]|uniref:RpiB/LacA/LacB family sugar-phosphate isomerase n=1 Tax=Catenibacterium mitsuokai TaxID=100886 RepID=UPI002E772AE3|nr:RpiB/LacA/LacB family sugar-phosphate isomerase [Catenibacterium tridentinum]